MSKATLSFLSALSQSWDRRARGAACRLCARGVRHATRLLLPILLAACNHAPQQDLLGSFFPAWMLCAALGVLASVVVRVVLGLAGINAYVPAAALTYICCAALVTMLIWLGWFGQ